MSFTQIGEAPYNAWSITKELGMTLRVTLEIVPYGVEEQKYTLSKINIHLKHTNALGNAEYYGTIVKPDGTNLEFDCVFHNRQDGALELVRKVLNDCESYL